MSRRLLYTGQIPSIPNFQIDIKESYAGKYFTVKSYLNGERVYPKWTITSGEEYASINNNGKVFINAGADNNTIQITASYHQTLTQTVSTTVSYDNELIIDGPDNIMGLYGNVVARYNSTVVAAEWNITSGSEYAIISSAGMITVLGIGTITVMATYSGHTATKNIYVTYDESGFSETEIAPDGSVTTTTTTTTTNQETGDTIITQTSSTTNPDGSVSTTDTTTTIDAVSGVSTSTSVTTNSDGTASESETTANSDGSYSTSTSNYDSSGELVSGENIEGDTDGNILTQNITYDGNGDGTVVGYTIDTSANSDGVKSFNNTGVNTGFYGFDMTEGFEINIHYIIDLSRQPTNNDTTQLNNILTMKRANPQPWYGFQIRYVKSTRTIDLGTQFLTGSNTNTDITTAGRNLGSQTYEQNFRITYDPTAASDNFKCWDLIKDTLVFKDSKVFPDITELRYMTVCVGYALDANGQPIRYSVVDILNFSITKLTRQLFDPQITCNGENVTITCATAGAAIYYRLDESGTFIRYTTPIYINTDTVVEAYSTLNSNTSNTVTETCIYVPIPLYAPAMSFDGTTLTITCTTPNAIIYYRLDNTGQFVIYTSPILLNDTTFVETYSELDGETSSIITETFVPAHDYSTDYLTFRITSDGTVAWKALGTNYERLIQYSVNGGVWTSITSANTAATISVMNGDVVRFKGSNSTYAGDKNNYSGFEGGTATFDIEGNIMSLVYGDNFAGNNTLTGTYNFCSIFKKSNVVSAENLILPATTLTGHCYRAMFSYAESLTTPPALPATTLAANCYWYMFEETAITSAPELPATSLTSQCYGNMFIDCNNLNYIKCMATSGINSTNLSNWVKNVSATGTFIKNENTTWQTGTNGIPSGWAIYDNNTPTP
jgi:hypothetical protein